MPNWYTNRGTLKAALRIPASTTGEHALLDDVLESVSRLVDNYLGFHAYPSSGTRYFTPQHTDCLYLDAPLLNVDAVQVTSDGATYGTTLATGGYFTTPYNATEESPRRPWWGLEISQNATSVFPAGLQRGARVQGTWGYFNERRSATAVLASGPNATQATLDLVGATSLHPGQTILIDSEQVFVVQTPASATGSHTSGITVLRGRNGTVVASHASGAAIQVYDYPIVDRAVLYQAMLDYRALDAPLGFTGGEPFGTQRPNMPGGLHPFVERMLNALRTPVVR